MTGAFGCEDPRYTPSGYGLGELYGCISGRAETVKLFANERVDTGEIKDIKLMWNDWFVDVGYGVHADQAQAEGWVRILASLYARGREDELIDIFLGPEDTSLVVEGYSLEYTYRRGPKIDERLFVLTPD